MNDDQLYYFLVDKNTRNVLQIEYPSDIDEFNKILGTSEGKGSLLKDLGIIKTNISVTFSNPAAVGTVVKNTMKKEATKSDKKSYATLSKKKVTSRKAQTKETK